MLTKVGLSPRQALAAATSNFEKILGWSKVGQVQRGYYADLLVPDNDPTTDVRNARKIRTIILSGSVLDRDKLLAR
jgi:imidazolonepropionase-like amidohydrolase